jgi:hypothetical protein
MDDEPPGKVHRWMHEWYRGKIEHEDHLIVDRITWLLTSEAFLFVAYVVLLAIPGDSMFDSSRVRGLLYFIPIIGLACDVIAAISVYGAIVAYRHAVSAFEKYDHDVRHRHEIELPELVLASSRMARALGKTAAVSVPVILFAAWLYLLWVANGLHLRVG